MSDFGSYAGEEFLGLELKKRDFIIDGLLREMDSVILVGGEKAGKSLFIQQMICSLTTGDHPFLDEYEINKACKVSYIQVEGELSDTQDRYKRMIQAVDFDPKNFQILFSEPLKLESEDECERIIGVIEKHHIPDVLILDPLYFSFVGSLSDDAIVRQFLGNIRRIKDKFGCAIIIVHHTHKIRFNQDGTTQDNGDDALFGSSALKWWPDHILFLTYNKKRGIREFRCSTQRSGDILDKLELRLEQPTPLYFRCLKTEDTANGMRIIEHLKGGEKTAKEIYTKLGISKASFYRDIKPSLKSKLIGKNVTHRPILYGLNNGP